MLEGRGPSAPEERDGRPYWPHARVGSALELVYDSDSIDADYSFLLQRRVKADYFTDVIGESAAAETARVARELLAVLEGDQKDESESGAG